MIQIHARSHCRVTKSFVTGKNEGYIVKDQTFSYFSDHQKICIRSQTIFGLDSKLR